MAPPHLPGLISHSWVHALLTTTFTCDSNLEPISGFGLTPWLQVPPYSLLRAHIYFSAGLQTITHTKHGAMRTHVNESFWSGDLLPQRKEATKVGWPQSNCTPATEVTQGFHAGSNFTLCSFSSPSLSFSPPASFFILCFHFPINSLQCSSYLKYKYKYNFDNFDICGIFF